MADRRFSLRGGVFLFGVAVFASAFLLFQVQPLLAKYILPWFGGSPAVWTACMLVFQLLLFAGYAYAHLLSSRLTAGGQCLVHAALLAAAAATLPIAPSSDWKPTGGEAPAWHIVLLLLANVGLPYFLLSATGPLLQSWFCKAQPGVAPYRLYALSNVGSLLALLSFPFLVEPFFSSTSQSSIWSTLFCLFAVTCMGCGWYATKATKEAAASPMRSSVAAPRTTYRDVVAWFSLAMLPSVLLLATTNQVCVDVAVIPFLWILPLAVYLLTFILTFESERWYRPRGAVLAAVSSMLLTVVVTAWGISWPIVLQVAIYMANLFTLCLVCHGELVRRKPDASRLTTFYLTISAGGAAGGIFVACVATYLFQGYYEFHLGVLGCVLVCGMVLLENESWWRERLSWGLKAACIATLLVAATWYFASSNRQDANLLARSRNFYGILRVKEAVHETTGTPVRQLVHGRILHGCQFVNPQERLQPTTYYTPDSGAGVVLGAEHPKPKRRVGVIGLGTGTLALYGREGDSFRFYEINPEVVRMAVDYFSFLEESKARTSVAIGDGRLLLERESSQAFDVLVLDAFSGDAIPVHLLTQEAMAIYRRHLADDGILAIHISNLHLDLEPVVAGMAVDQGMCYCHHLSDPSLHPGSIQSRWMVLATSDRILDEFFPHRTTSERGERLIHWTDDWNNLLHVMPMWR